MNRKNRVSFPVEVEFELPPELEFRPLPIAIPAVAFSCHSFAYINKQ